MHKITPWITHDGCSLRHIVGHDVDDIRNRVALIEKSPRVRIRAAHLGEATNLINTGVYHFEISDRRWPEHLDWCYGTKGDGPNDKESKAWCDAMLKLLGYELE